MMQRSWRQVALVAVIAAGCATMRTSPDQYALRVSGTAGVPYTGTYMVTRPNGSMASESFEGTLPAQGDTTIAIDGRVEGAAVIKRADTGAVRLDVLRNGFVVGTATTATPHGTATVTIP